MAAVQRALAKDLHDRAAEARLSSIQERIKTLTPRETEVFALVVTGMLNKQIAFQRGVGEKTIKVHRARVMEKMRAWPSWSGWPTEWASSSRAPDAALLGTLRWLFPTRVRRDVMGLNWPKEDCDANE